MVLSCSQFLSCMQPHSCDRKERDRMARECTRPLDVATAISRMATAVQLGNFVEAEAIGASAAFPLSISKAAVALGRVLSEGAQAVVYEAQLSTAALPEASNPGASGPASAAQAAPTATIAVAVKRARIRESRDLDRFRFEVQLLAELQHPHVVDLVGARLLPPEYALFMGLEATNAAHELHAAGWRPGWAGAAALGAQLAAAVAHLHSAGVVHRDLKPANVLLSADRATAKLTDLGIAMRLESHGGGGGNGALAGGPASKPSGGFHKQHMVGTLEYMAPEVLLRQPHSPASDVFALAVVVSELASGQVPYSDCTRDNPLAHTILEMGFGRQELATAVATEGLRPTLAAGVPPSLLHLLRACWDAVPARRPTAAAVAAKLAEIAAQLAAGANGVGVQSNAAVPPRTLASPPAVRPAELPAIEEGNPSWAERLLAAHSAAPAEGAAAELPIGSFAAAGLRGEDKMEDRCTVVRGFNALPGVYLMAVFDGHRGAEASDYLAASLEWHVLRRWAGSASAGELLRRALLDADEAFRAQQDAAWAEHCARMGAAAPAARRYPGSTAVAALLVGRALAVANLGDSRAVLCRGGHAVALTRDQTAEREDERARIVAAGGDASVRVGAWRVGAAGLQVTRSVGDSDLKGQGVSAEAEVAEVEVGEGDSFLILGSDGLWEWVGGDEAVELVHDTVKQAAMCAQRLVMEALARGSRDNVTAVVAFLDASGGAPTAEVVFQGGQLRYGGGGGAAKRVAARLVEDEMRDTY